MVAAHHIAHAVDVHLIHAAVAHALHQLTGAGLVLVGTGADVVFAKAKPRADKVLWGGLGFSVREAEIERRLPFVKQAIAKIGYKNVVAGFTDLLEKKYLSFLVLTICRFENC